MKNFLYFMAMRGKADSKKMLAENLELSDEEIEFYSDSSVAEYYYNLFVDDYEKTFTASEIKKYQDLLETKIEVLDNIKVFVNRLWNGNDASSEVPEELMKGDFRKNAAASGFKTTEERLQELLNKDNRGHLVKNSDLLTYYDRSGHISKVNASDRIRIMEGDAKDIYL